MKDEDNYQDDTSGSPDKKGPKGQGVAKGTFRVVTAPVRAIASTGVHAYGSFKKATESVDSVKDFGKSSFENIRRSGKKGRNDTFDSIFSGEEGEVLRQKNIARFLLRKRAALLLMLFFSLYGAGSVIAFQQFYGLLTFAGGVFFGTTLCLESEFRLWQLRLRRLSVEEKGSFKDFFKESPIHNAFKPEIFKGEH